MEILENAIKLLIWNTSLCNSSFWFLDVTEEWHWVSPSFPMCLHGRHLTVFYILVKKNSFQFLRKINKDCHHQKYVNAMFNCISFNFTKGIRSLKNTVMLKTPLFPKKLTMPSKIIMDESILEEEDLYGSRLIVSLLKSVPKLKYVSYIIWSSVSSAWPGVILN